MYLPPNIQKSSALTEQRILLQGRPGCGKTTFAASFPNPVFIDLDHKLPGDVPNFPFWDDNWCKSLTKVPGAHKRDIIIAWLRSELPKFESNQTVIFDSWTKFQDFLNVALQAETAGDKETFKFYRLKNQYSQLICDLLSQAKCRVIVTAHETEALDESKQGAKIYPLQEGKFGNQLAGYFTDYYRIVNAPTKRDANGAPVKNGAMNQKETGRWLVMQPDEECDLFTNPELGKHNPPHQIQLPRDGGYEVYNALYKSAK